MKNHVFLGLFMAAKEDKQLSPQEVTTLEELAGKKAGQQLGHSYGQEGDAAGRLLPGSQVQEERLREQFLDFALLIELFRPYKLL